MDNTVEMMAAQMQDDAAVTTQENTPTQTLADVIGETPVEQPVQTAQEQPKEPGWIKQRVGAAVNKAVAEAEARIRAEYEAQLAPLREAQLEREADQLVADGKIADREIALDYLRSKKGMPAANTTDPAKSAPQRDAQGRFISDQPSADIKQKAATLVAQADVLTRTTGIDLMALYNNDPAVKQKVISGEWDFVNVLNFAQQNAVEEPTIPAMPAPVRSANVGLGGVSISKMSDAQLDKMNELLRGGGKINV
jgi:hypothetical protein